MKKKSGQRNSISARQGELQPAKLWLRPDLVMIRLVILSIQSYSYFISPVLPSSCRFQPSCSLYAVYALRGKGFWLGSGLAIWRILRCHPWSAGGYDPVPEDTKEANSINT